MRTAAPQVKQRIADAAARLFAVDRFHEVRMDDIAAETGVSKGTLYRYFSDKEDLYRELIAAASQQLLREIDARLGKAATPLLKLEAIVGGFFEFFEDRMFFFDLLQRVEALDSKGPNASWSQTRQELLGRIAENTARCQSLESANQDDTAIGPLMLFGAMRAVLRLGARPRPVDLARQLVHHYLFGLLSNSGEDGGRPSAKV